MFREVLALRTEVEAAVMGLGKRVPNARETLNLLYRKPIITAMDIEQNVSVTTPTANAILRDFVSLGILRELTGQPRWRSYCFVRYLRLFSS